MGQTPKGLTPDESLRHFLGSELRRWRELRGMSAAELARRVFVSRELVQKVETAQRNASDHLISSCDDELETGGTLARLLDFVTQAEAVARAEAEAVAKAEASPREPPSPGAILLRFTVEVIGPGAVQDAPPWLSPRG